jgi:hypothetical protein
MGIFSPYFFQIIILPIKNVRIFLRFLGAFVEQFDGVVPYKPNKRVSIIYHSNLILGKVGKLVRETVFCQLFSG